MRKIKAISLTILVILGTIFIPYYEGLLINNLLLHDQNISLFMIYGWGMIINFTLLLLFVCVGGLYYSIYQMVK